MSPVARQGGAPEAPFKVTLRERVSSGGPQLSQDTGHALPRVGAGAARASQDPGPLCRVGGGGSCQQPGSGVAELQQCHRVAARGAAGAGPARRSRREAGAPGGGRKAEASLLVET